MTRPFPSVWFSDYNHQRESWSSRLGPVTFSSCLFVSFRASNFTRFWWSTGGGRSTSGASVLAFTLVQCRLFATSSRRKWETEEEEEEEMLGKKRECVCVCAQVLSPRRRTRGLDAALYVSHVFNRVFAQMDRTGRQLSWNQDRFAILQPSESRKFSLSLSFSFSLLFLIFAQRQMRPSINRRNQSTDPELLVVTFANRSPPSLLFSSFYNLSLSNRGPFRYAQSCRMSTVAPRRERFSICRQLHRYGDICAQDRIICLGVVSSLIVVIERKRKRRNIFQRK